MAGRGTVIVGTGAVTAEETIALTRHAEKAGVDGALILPPYFVKLTDDEIFAHYRDVADKIGLPLPLYNIPGNAVNALSPALVVRLADLDTGGRGQGELGRLEQFLRHAPRRSRQAPGVLRPLLDVRRAGRDLGADGTIDCFPNVWPHGGLDLYLAAQARRCGEARPRSAGDGPPADRSVHRGGRTLYPATKAAMDMLGLPGGGVPRPRCAPLEGEPLEGSSTVSTSSACFELR